MPHAAAFYSNGHLTRKARRHLARLYLEAEQDDALTSRIARQQNKQQETSGDVPPAIPGASTSTMEGKRTPNFFEKPAKTLQNDVGDNYEEPNRLQKHTESSGGNFDNMVIADMEKEQWGDSLRKTPRPEISTPISRNDLNWGSIINYEQRQYEDLIKQVKHEREEAKERYRRSLFDQMKEHKKVEQKKRLAELNEVEEWRKQQQLINKQNQELVAEHRKKMGVQKNSRIQQIKEREEHRRQELKESEKMQKRAAESLKKKLEADRAYAIAKKEENCRVQWDLILHNDRQRAAKLVLAEKEKEDNKRLQKIYEDLQNKQEQERLKVLEIRHEKQRRHDAGHEAVRKNREQLLRNEEERTARDQLIIAEMQTSREKKESETKQHALEENQTALLKQIKENQERRAATKKIEHEYKKKLLEIARHDRQRIELATARANEEKRRLEDELRLQIKEYEEKRLLQKTEMTDIERCLNQRILDEIAEQHHLE